METTTKSTTSRNSSTSKSADHAPGADALEIREAWDEASHALEKLYAQASSTVQATVKERPYVALAAAAGLGFVLGGGLRSVTGRYLLRTTAQLAIPVALAALKGTQD